MILKIFLSLLVLLLAVAAFTGIWGYRELHTPIAHQKDRAYVEIPRGSSVDQILQTLEENGVIRHKWPLLAYIRYTGAASRLKAGEYTFSSPITPLEVLQKLGEGQQRLARFTVIEGWTRWEVAAAMARIPELKLDQSQIMRLLDETGEIKEIDPQAPNLEGYLYPDTYSFPPDATAPQMISGMVQRYKKLWEEKYAAMARERGMGARQVLTVASLIETEAKLREERPLVASVIYNRLQKGMPLGIDSTVIYAAKLAGKWRNDGKVYQSYLDLPSPYNTRKNVGLPPGPVASPGAASIEAALRPTETDYLFYVRDPARNDGAHNFYADSNDFQRGVQALREWEKQRDARANANAAGL